MKALQQRWLMILMLMAIAATNNLIAQSSCDDLINIDLASTPVKYVKVVAHIYFPKHFECDPEKQELAESLAEWLKNDVVNRQVNFRYRRGAGQDYNYNPGATARDTRIEIDLLHTYFWYSDAASKETNHRLSCLDCSSPRLDNIAESGDLALQDSEALDVINVHFPYAYSNSNGWGRASGVGDSRSSIIPDLINYYENVRQDRRPSGELFGVGEKAFSLGGLLAHELGHNLGLQHNWFRQDGFREGGCADYHCAAPRCCRNCSFRTNNVMDYGGQSVFTIGQAQIMHNFLEANPNLYYE